MGAVRSLVIRLVWPWVKQVILPAIQAMLLRVLMEEADQRQGQFYDWYGRRQEERQRRREERRRQWEERASHASTDEERSETKEEARAEDEWAAREAHLDEQWRMMFDEYERHTTETMEARIREMKIDIASDGKARLVVRDDEIELAPPTGSSDLELHF